MLCFLFLSYPGSRLMFRNFPAVSRSVTVCVRSLSSVRSMASMGTNNSKQSDSKKSTPTPVYKVGEEPKPELTFTEEELRAKLSPEEYNVTQEKGTERAWTGRYVNVKENGNFNCVVCDTQLFDTSAKFESGSGWPSFSDVINQGNVLRIVDEAYGMVRTEVVCAKCGAHLGHMFDDGPKEDTGLRYCINSNSLKFKADT